MWSHIALSDPFSVLVCAAGFLCDYPIKHATDIPLALHAAPPSHPSTHLLTLFCTEYESSFNSKQGWLSNNPVLLSFRYAFCHGSWGNTKRMGQWAFCPFTGPFFINSFQTMHKCPAILSIWPILLLFWLSQWFKICDNCPRKLRFYYWLPSPWLPEGNPCWFG